MALTQEQQVIFDAILSSLQTNSKTISQLTPQSSLGDNDWFELNGGRKVSYSVLRDLIASMSSTDMDSLRTLINKNVLKSASLDVSESAATLTIKSVGTTISCDVPVATTDKAGIITAADKLKLKSAYETAETALEAAEEAVSTAEAAKSTADAAQITANAAKKVTDSKGLPGGIAPLDDNGKVPLSHIPRSLDDVKYFDGFLAISPPALQDISVADCNVLFDPAHCTFIAQSKADAGVFSANWADADFFGALTPEGRIPDKDKIYVDRSTDKAYWWTGTQMRVIGSDLALGHTASTAFPGDEGAALQEKVTSNTTNIEVVRESVRKHDADTAIEPFDAIVPDDTMLLAYPKQIVFIDSMSKFQYIPESMEGDGALMLLDEYNELISGHARQDKIFRKGNELYRFNGENLVKVGGASVGNTYNLTAEVPTSDPDRVFYHMADPEDTYYAPAVVLARKKAMLGLQITFAIAKGTWKTYQYVGTDLTEDSVLDPDNWLDLAGMSAGSEPFVNVNQLCGQRDYTLSLAIQALIDLRTSSGIDYLKEGMVITYRRSSEPDVWEAKQFHGAITDLSPANEELWSDFGSGGSSDVKTSDEPVKDGKDALSTGGAYDLESRQFGGLEIQPDPDDYIIQAVDRKGAAIGDPVNIPKSAGGGQQGSTISIYCEQAVWAAFGAETVLMAAIKSVNYDGNNEVLGTIKSIAITDPVTGIELWREDVNQSSSTSASDLKFKFDFTPYITAASSRDFVISATDADGNRRTRTITVTAVDVTCSSIQTLNYDTRTVLTAGSSEEKSIPMYKFANNVSTRLGIEVKTEMLFGGEWRELGKAVITDTYSHNISINPSNVFGGSEQLAHGAYFLRIQGTDLASGVKGNTLYTSVMCIDPTSTAPVVAMRYDDRSEGKIRLYDTLSVDVAAYTPGKTETPVEVLMDAKVISSVNCPATAAHTVTKQIRGYATDGSESFPIFARSGQTQSGSVTITVQGSAINATIKEGAVFDFDFSSRDNSEADHTISDNGIGMTLRGCNYSSNGYVRVLDETVLRIAENVKAEIDYAPFASPSLETSGCSIQMAFSTARVKDKNAKLCSCYDPAGGFGFYITGNEVVMTLANGTPSEARIGFNSKKKHTLAIVVEPGSKTVSYQGTEYAFVKMYLDGEEAGCIGYRPGTGALRQSRNISFDGTDGDFNLNYIMAYPSAMEWHQAFQNYLCKTSDVSAMIAEYDKNNVLDASGKPSMSMMAEKGIPYYVVVADKQTFDNFDFALHGGTDTSDKFLCTLYYYNPQHPEVSFKATNVQWRRQGTTSAQRPEKNDRFYFRKNKNTVVTLLSPDDRSKLGHKAILAAKHNMVYVSEKGFFVDVVTVKKDYSDSSMANDSGVCDMMNTTYRTLGGKFMTPAQRAFDGTQDLGDGDVLTDIELDHSTKNHPVACFRATTDTLQDAWFQARGNWKEDKGEQVALGFKNVPGYNLGCLNYGDFIEFFGKPIYDSNGHYTDQESLDQIEARFKATAGLDTTKPYLLSLYCGRNYRIMRYKNGEWQRSNGSMRQVNGKWVVTGDVLNPVTGYELLQYAGMCWWKGVKTVDDMMKPTTQMSSWVRKLGLSATEYPAWTFYFECMVDDDQLQIDLALGKKVPYELFKSMTFFSSVNYSMGGGWADRWRKQAHRIMSIESMTVYVTFTDYMAAYDQRAKNMQPMYMLEDGCYVINGEYFSPTDIEPIRMYLNKIYDCDTCNKADNDGGRNSDPEVDPNKPSDPATGYVNPYMGSGSILFNNIALEPEVWNNDDGSETISLKSVAARMRSITTQVDGITLAPFSPDGARHYFLDKRVRFWPKVITTYDCELKYIERTSFANQPYFYALHGSCESDLEQFIDARWAIRDGYYQTGEFFTNPLSGRVSAISADSEIRITAARTGYFGIGNDASGQLSESVYLEAGESHAFSQFAHDAGALLYIYQPGRMAAIDLSEMTLAINFNDLSKLELAEDITLGGENHTSDTPLNGFEPLGSVICGDLPFLRELDVSHTAVTSIDASRCPRMESINASSTALTSCAIAQTAPITSLALPASITSLELVNLPELSYPGGLSLAGTGNVSRLWIEGCPRINPENLLLEIGANRQLNEVRVPDIEITASPVVLQRLMASGAVGLDAKGNAYAESGRCSGLSGKWIMSDYTDAELIETLSSYFVLLSVLNQQFSTVIFSDDESDAENISNADNKTGFKYSTDSLVIPYSPSGHVARLRDTAPIVRAKLNTATGKMEIRQLDRDSLLKYADGTAFDPTDGTGQGYDVMKFIPRYWYKGVNDFANSEKLFFISVNAEKPLSTAHNVVDKQIKDFTVQRDATLAAAGQVVGGDPVTSDSTNTIVVTVPVAGMRLVRFPGFNSAAIGNVFVDDMGKIVEVFTFANSKSDMLTGNYLIARVPEGAESFIFTAPRGNDNAQVILSDSDNVESVEPDWQIHYPELIGTYRGSTDGQKHLRSLSGTMPTHGDNASGTNSEWSYDGEGNPTNLMAPASTIHWTMKDLSNAAALHGKGFQLQDYESWKDFSIMAMCIRGTRDMQSSCGMGGGDGRNVTSGAFNVNNPNGFSNYPSRDINCWGLQNYFGCGGEWLDNVAVNVASFRSYKKNRSAYGTADPVDYQWAVYNPSSGAERKVQSVTGGSGSCIAKFRWGKFCDIVPSQLSASHSSWSLYTGDTYEFQGDRGRAVVRAGNYGYANHGLVYAYARDASSYSYTFYGARLAFRGEIVSVDA